MINFSTDRGKYIIEKTPAPESNIDAITYTVSLNNTTIFQGSSKYFGGKYEVDCSDWIEQWIVKQSNEGNNPIHCNLYLLFRFYVDGDNRITIGAEKNWYPEILNMDTPNQIGMICGGSAGYPRPGQIGDWEGYATSVAVYPLFFFRMSCKIDGKDFYDDNVMWDPNGINTVSMNSGESKYSYTVFDASGSGNDIVNDSMIMEYQPSVIGSQMSSIFGGPKLTFHDGDQINTINFSQIYSSVSLMPDIEPLFSKEYTSYSEVSAQWGWNSFLRYSEEELKDNYTDNVETYINKLMEGTYTLPADATHSTTRTMTDFSLELVGYGYKTMM